MDLQDGSFNREDVVTAKLDTVKVLFAGVLKKTEAENIKAEPLLMTSASAGLVKADSADLAVRINPDAMNKNLEEKDGPLVLAYKLTGKFKSAFPEGITVTSEEGEPDGKTKKIEGLRKAAEETTVIVCSDVDLISDFVAFQENFFGTKAVGDNANFVLNCVENLGGSKMLIAARSRGRFGRSFKVISEIEKKAEKRTADRIEAVGVEIERYQEELDSLKGGAGEGGTSLLQKEAVEKERKLQDRLMNARRELRELNKEKRVEIERLIDKIKIYNMAVVPLAVPLLALAVFIAGFLKRRKHSGPKNEK
jgi:ABC-type uncharacterized transport system involved in gliding motility auxiliary subunit